jgi:hypothetical protein
MKSKLLEKCIEIIREKKALLEKNIELALEASKDDIKSSAGDKYETTRAMMQIEIDSNRKRLLEAQALENILDSLDINIEYEKVSLGALVFTNHGIFFVAVGLGNVKIEDKSYYVVISPDSPIGAILMNKKVGDAFLFNQRDYQILKVI